VSSLAIQFLNGLAGASTLFLVAVGLSLIFGVTRVVNFAHGSLYMLGIYIAYSVISRAGGGEGLLDHQSTMGAYVGRTALKDGRGVMTGFSYADGAKFMPSDDEVRRMRPRE